MNINKALIMYPRNGQMSNVRDMQKQLGMSNLLHTIAWMRQYQEKIKRKWCSSLWQSAISIYKFRFSKRCI